MLGKKGISIKDLFESLGGDGLVMKVAELLEAKAGAKPELQPDDFSLREIYEAVDVSTFSTLTGTLISKKIMDSYLAAPTIGDQLVTSFQSSLQVDRVGGAGLRLAMRKIKPGMPYGKDSDIEEAWVQITGSKYGAILDITEEAIMFDQTGQILLEAGKIGLAAAAFKEKHILYTIQDQAGFEAYYPKGVQTALYSTGAGSHLNLITDALVDHTDINAARKLLAKMTGANGDPILALARTILTPVALEMTAGIIYKSPVIIGGANAQPNPYVNMFTPLSSPYLDAVSDKDWYFGDFKREFLWKEVIPLQVLTRKSNDNEDSWNRDIIASYKARYYGECGAQDYKFVVKSDSV